MYTVIELPELTSRAQAEAHAQAVCFRQGRPTLIGAELELLTEHPGLPDVRPSTVALAAAFGSHTPKSIDPDSPAQPLPNGGLVTVEPGGQTEISSAPFATVEQLCQAMREDLQVLRTMLDPHQLRLINAGADAHRPAEAVHETPRYRATMVRWEQEGGWGKLNGCNTCATQVSVDAGATPAEIAARWQMLWRVGPALTAAFASTPALRGVPEGEWVSQRTRTWLGIDKRRTLPAVDEWADPAAGYASWALDAPVFCIRRESGDWSAPPEVSFADWIAGKADDLIERRPTLSDLEYHLTTLFPAVRPQGHFEVRYLDGQPGDLWTVPVYAIAALTVAPNVVTEATLLADATNGRWEDAGRIGLADPELRAAAASLLELATEHADSPIGTAELAAAARRCKQGQAPAA